MRPGNSYVTAEFDSEILRSGDFQLISITVDSTATYDPTGASPSTKLPKGLLLVLDDDLSDNTYIDLDTVAGNNNLNGTPTQFMKDVVVLAETILDASLGDQPVKAYWKGTFDLAKLKYTGSGVTAITLAQWLDLQRITVVGLPDA